MEQLSFFKSAWLINSGVTDCRNNPNLQNPIRLVELAQILFEKLIESVFQIVD